MALNGGSSFIVGNSPAITALESVLTEIAVTSIPILLSGETGTGKETYARRIHELSLYRDGQFTRVGCTSAEAGKCLADFERNGTERHGTILLDEITELDAACQRKLLNALPDGEIPHRSGWLAARIVSTTSRNIDDEVRAGRFRSDLFYRINGVCLRIPPLRNRQEDIQALAECFLTKHAVQLGKPRPTLSERTRQALLNYSWPGNVRELENVMKKMVALSDDSIVTSELEEAAPERKASFASSTSYSLKAAARAASRVAERELILKALERTRWNRKRAAQELQISYKSLLYKLKQIGVQES
jgi:two-component system, NtrC family, response regulator AtoC